MANTNHDKIKNQDTKMNEKKFHNKTKETWGNLSGNDIQLHDEKRGSLFTRLMKKKNGSREEEDTQK